MMRGLLSTNTQELNERVKKGLSTSYYHLRPYISGLKGNCAITRLDRGLVTRMKEGYYSKRRGGKLRGGKKKIKVVVGKSRLVSFSQCT